jgi:hypothetical protein
MQASKRYGFMTSTQGKAHMVDRPLCPRCGYDQTGTVDTWTDQCPLESLCPECGYTFLWSDVFYPDRQRLSGFFEHERGLWPSFVAAWRTMAWIILPFVFWNRVRMHHEVRVRRVLLWPIVVFGSMWGAISLLRATAFFVDGAGGVGVGSTLKSTLIDLSNAFVFPVFYMDSTIWAISRTGMPVTRPGVSVNFLLLDWSPVFLGIFGQAFAVPILLLMLPVTRRRCKIRKIHVLRAAVYGQSWVFFHFLLLLITAALGAITADWDLALGMSGPITNFMYEHRLIYALFIAGWIATWWWCALAIGFRMPHATRHWFGLMVAAVLILLLGLVSDWRVGYQLLSWF